MGLGFKYAYLYHLGSLCLGSFIIAVIQLIRITFYYFAKKAEALSGGNCLVKMVSCVGNCCLACIEKVCDYITCSGYAYMAVSGEGFCLAAWHGFLLNIKHGAKFGFANLLANFFIFGGKLAIVSVNCLVVFWYMTKVSHERDELDSITAPIVVVGIASYMAANIFLGLFDEVVLALMTSRCIDQDMNKQPKYGPPTFYDEMKFFGKKDKKHVDYEFND